MNKIRLAVYFLSLCLLFVSIGAGTLEVSEDICIIGNGTIDRDLQVQSSPSCAGQKLTETIYSVHGNPLSSTYMSSLELIHSNNSTIYYTSDSDLSEVKHYIENKNYELGIYTGFHFIGDQNKTFSFESSPSLSEALVESEVDGRSVIRMRVINKSNYHYPTVDSLTWLEGDYTLDWSFLVIDYEFPEAGEEDDWLKCPNSP